MNAKRILTAFVAALLSTFCALAQSLMTDDGVKNWEVSVTGGLNTDGFQLDAGVAYFPVQYFGMRMAIGMASEIQGMWSFIGGALSDYDYMYWDENDYYARFKYTAAFDLRSPCIIPWKSANGGFYLFAQPGITLSPYERGKVEASWLNWDLKCGINLQVDRCIISLGYGVSDYCLYTGHWPRERNPEPDWWTHSLFLAISAKF